MRPNAASPGKRGASAGAALATVERQLADARASAARPVGATQSTAARRPATGASATAAANNDALIVGIRQRISAGQLIDPKGDSARDLLGQLRAADASSPAADELARALSTRLLDSGKQAMAAKAYERSQVLLAAAREVGARYNEAALIEARDPRFTLASSIRERSSARGNDARRECLKLATSTEDACCKVARRCDIDLRSGSTCKLARNRFCGHRSASHAPAADDVRTTASLGDRSFGVEREPPMVATKCREVACANGSRGGLPLGDHRATLRAAARHRMALQP